MDITFHLSQIAPGEVKVFRMMKAPRQAKRLPQNMGATSHIPERYAKSLARLRPHSRISRNGRAYIALFALSLAAARDIA